MSSKHPEPLDLERDLSTTAADVAALRSVREDRKMSFAEYLRFLSRLRARPAESRKTFEGCDRFEL